MSFNNQNRISFDKFKNNFKRISKNLNKESNIEVFLREGSEFFDEKENKDGKKSL
jgi:hypothetical protein